MDELFLVLIIAACIPLLYAQQSRRKAEHDKAVRLLGLSTADGKRFFEAIHASRNRRLFRDHFRMDAAAFDELFERCRPFIRDTVRNQREVLAVALHWIGNAATCRSQEVLFDLTYSTIHKYRTRGVRAIVQALVGSLEIPSSVPGDFIQRHPYYEQALGVIDCTHFQVEVAREDIIRYCNHKGCITTNVLIFCDWGMKVCFAYVGAEGSAHDSTVLRWSRLLELLPDNYFVLGDAGYGLSDQVLTPYRGVRYHLKEWAQRSSGRPQNAKEFFNLRHAKARNVVERVIGVLKRRFKVLRTCMDYELTMIKTVIFTCILAHNFIRDFDASDLGRDFSRPRREARAAGSAAQTSDAIPFDFENGENWRNWMSSAMWSEYEQFQRGSSDNDEISDTDSISSDYAASDDENSGDSDNSNFSDN